MSIFTGFIVYALVWWTILFAILPIGTNPEPSGDDTTGGWRGVPGNPRILRKVLITTAVSTVIWLGIIALIQSDWLSFRSGWLALPER